ncbi:chemotaxis protein CheB [Desulfovibrio piger]|jgi:two-component system CheB/CheR fusion protein|uniref:chemotaxis protein CheB n=1 Tax=Desulfovibrio piger TaxID=901 RepID=UPI00195E6048|nr:chemotaxis protein CheB [Desulfovibrio piger]MBM6836544.1 PAS domain-containing protein [Desulfovibrio piger]
MQESSSCGQQVSLPFIVGIGASAGGLEALQQFFSAVPDNSGLAFVVIQHLSPDYKSLMAEILGKYTSMMVLQAENGMEVEPNIVYLIPPKKNMTIKNGRLLLTDYVHGAINHPIDTFLASLAEERKAHALCVILSGTGSDGTSGIKSIKEHDGLVLVQDPASAKFDGMPRSAINTGLADFVLPPRELAEEILNFSNYPAIVDISDNEELFSDKDTLSLIYLTMKRVSGIDFTYYKKTTVLRRIERRMVVTHCPTLSSFAHLLEENQNEVDLLVKDILIGVTKFFRDAEFFEKLKHTVIYNILENSGSTDPIRIWSAGCSTGEEAYSLAILFHEAMDEKKLHRDIKIFATDVDTKAIEQAGKGVFSESIVDDVSAERLARFFIKRNDQYQICKDIRKMIIFAPHNMLSDPPFGKLALICCRNVLIYFQPVLQKGLFAIFHSALKNGGYLFLGKSETASEYSKVFTPVSIAEKIYMHRSDAKMDDLMPPAFNIPNIQTAIPSATGLAHREENNLAMENVYSHFLEKFLPASVVVDDQNNILHFFGGYSDYLNLAPGKATFNFFTLVNKDINLVSSTAINRCRMEKKAVTYTGVSVDTLTGRRVIDLSVQPIIDSSGIDTGLLAILFVEHGETTLDGIVEKYDINITAAQRITDLEHELQVSQNDLRTTIGELETVNEELQAANEELLTANEELQSSNEELQSVNEELYTVNSEFQQKLDELTTMTNDLSNFLSSTMIGILFVDSHLNIRKFTEYIGREFQLESQDVGRSMQIFAHSFPDEDIVTDARNVLKDLTPVDREVVGMNGRFYTMRIAPYRTTENSIRGLVITVIDSLGSSNERTRESDHETSSPEGA